MNEYVETTTIRQIMPAPEGYYAEYIDVDSDRKEYFPVVAIGLVEVEERIKGKGMLSYGFIPKALIFWPNGDLRIAEQIPSFSQVIHEDMDKLQNN